jgi:hypothetical protein
VAHGCCRRGCGRKRRRDGGRKDGLATDRCRGALQGRSLHPCKETSVRGILLWVLGIPIPVIILLYLFHVI